MLSFSVLLSFTLIPRVKFSSKRLFIMFSVCFQTLAWERA